MKYKVEVDAHVTRYCIRNITVHAKDESEAIRKALLKWDKIERAVRSSVDPGEPSICDIMEVKS